MVPKEVLTQEMEQKEEQSRLSDQFFLEVIQSLSSDLLFRHNLQTNTMQYFGAAREALGLPELAENYPQCLIEQNVFYPEDVDGFLAQVEDMRRGVEAPCDFRFFQRDGTPAWFRKEYRLSYDSQGRPLEAIGRSRNIQSQKELENQISFDRLTNCYRKEMFETLATHYMEYASHFEHTLLIMDLDNFKAINDNLGHQFGDMVLREVGEKLKSIFRSTDLVGRIGGDEFMVLMKNTGDTVGITRKINQLLDQMDTTYQGPYHSHRISASVGVAVYGRDGKTFKELYDHADIALFDAKNRGKNDFVFYDATLSKGTMENTLAFDVATRVLSQHFDYKIVAEIFSLLFENGDLEVSMEQVLHILGERFGVSRVYVFECSPQHTDCYDNTYEWCAKGVSSEKEMLQEVPMRIFEPFFDHANEDGIIYCNDLDMLGNEDSKEIMETQGIQSFLHAYIRSGNKFSYVLGFDDCQHPRVWSPMEIATLLHVSKIIAQFVNYKNAIDTMKIINEERLTVLDTLNCSAYIVDIETFSLIYYNRYTQEKYPHLHLGDLCHEGIRGCDNQCDDCPLREIQEEQVDHIRRVVYNDMIGEYLLVNATKLPSYDGKESIFVSVNELTGVEGVEITSPMREKIRQKLRA
ncbi:diguanylate cyclase [Bengtsoniella intestinalis]|uniref:sensor domain-containing diguanylate cyclase n=1 Tax=Bengtsoniella intestinalis TaxID=3073143 RepID=UPI00391F3AE5